MKRLFSLFITGLFLTGGFQVSHAQTSKGNWLLGGSGTFQHLHYGENRNNTNIQFFPKGGLFVANNLAVGIMPSLNIDLNANNDPITTNFNTYTLSIGPFIRYYYSLSPVVKLFAEGYFTYGRQFYKPENNLSDYNRFNWRIGPGAAFFVTPSVSLDISAGYGQFRSATTGDAVKTKNTTGITDVQLGFSIYLPGKKNK